MSREKPDTKKETTIRYQDEGKGLVTRRCPYCQGTGRVYEGGYGLRDCKACD